MHGSVLPQITMGYLVGAYCRSNRVPSLLHMPYLTVTMIQSVRLNEETNIVKLFPKLVMCRTLPTQLAKHSNRLMAPATTADPSSKYVFRRFILAGHTSNRALLLAHVLVTCLVDWYVRITSTSRPMMTTHMAVLRMRDTRRVTYILRESWRSGVRLGRGGSFSAEV
jgi:hypothetical protein